MYITDSQQVKGGIEAILQGKKRRQRSHRDLWKRIEAALKAKGLANHKVEKVKAHQSKQMRGKETAEEASKRRRNEEADKRAVEAAARNAPPSQLAEKRKKAVQNGKRIQEMMLKILEKRGELMKAWGQDGSRDSAAHRMREAKRNDPRINELITKELAERGTDEPESVDVGELAGDRKTVFPSHTWEPRASDGTTPYQEMDEPETLTRDEWPYRKSLWKPLVWYWRTMQWKETADGSENSQLGGSSTPWLFLAFDFRAATMERTSKTGRAEREETLETIAREFHLASRRMLQRCHQKEKHKEVRNVSTMRGLDMPVCSGIDRVVILKKPETLNRFLHELAIKMCTGAERRSWKIKVEWPDTGEPIYTEELSPTLKKRLEDSEQRRQEICLPREKERAKPPHAVIMAAVQAEESDERRWAKMPPRLRTRDQKRVIHNKTAVEKGLHMFPPFTSMDEWTLKCLRCKRDIDLWSKNGHKKVFNLTARFELKCDGEEFQGEDQGSIRKNGTINPRVCQLQMQNQKKREANQKNWGITPRKHIFYLGDMASFGEVRCRRPQCWLHKEPRSMETWLTLQQAECRRTKTKNRHQAQTALEIPPLKSETRGSVPDEIFSGSPDGQRISSEEQHTGVTGFIRTHLRAQERPEQPDVMNDSGAP